MNRTEKTSQYPDDGQRVAVQTLVSGSVETDDRYFVFGNYIDETLLMHAGAADLYYAHDHLYSPVVLFAANGTVAERYEYDAYGQVQILNSEFLILNSSQHGNPYTFTGRELDTLDAGRRTLMYYRARTTDPETGRFMQRDPLDYVDGTNLYEYVRSNSIVLIDPFGLAVLWKDTNNIKDHWEYISHESKFTKGGSYNLIRCCQKINNCSCRYPVADWGVLSEYDLYNVITEREQIQYVQNVGVAYVSGAMAGISVATGSVALINALVPEPFLTKATAAVTGIVSVGTGLGSWAISGYVIYETGDTRWQIIDSQIKKGTITSKSTYSVSDWKILDRVGFDILDMDVCIKQELRKKGHRIAD